MNEKAYRVMELKGLLEGLQDHIFKVNYHLTENNVQQLTVEVAKMRDVIDRIETKANAFNDGGEENVEDDF